MAAKDQFRRANGPIQAHQPLVMSRLEWFEALKTLYFRLDSEQTDSVDRKSLLLELQHCANSLHLRSETDYFACERAESAFSLSQLRSVLQETQLKVLTWDQLFDLVIQLPPYSLQKAQKQTEFPISAASDCFLQSSLATNTLQSTFSQMERGSGGGTERSSRENTVNRSFGRSKLVTYPGDLAEMGGNLLVRPT